MENDINCGSSLGEGEEVIKFGTLPEKSGEHETLHDL